MSFPVGASVGDKYTLGNIQYEFNGTAWDLAGSVAGNAVEEIESRTTTNENSINNIDGRVTTNEVSIDNIDTRVTTAETNKLDTADLLTEIKAVDGSGSGLDADLVRGLPADFTSSLAANGYQKLPSGLIIQWQTFTSDSDANQDFTFALSFPNKCFKVFITSIDSSGAAEIGIAYGIKEMTHTGFTVDRDDNIDGVLDFAVLAIGY